MQDETCNARSVSKLCVANSVTENLPKSGQKYTRYSVRKVRKRDGRRMRVCVRVGRMFFGTAVTL